MAYPGATPVTPVDKAGKVLGGSGADGSPLTTQSAVLPTGTNRSKTVTTTSTSLAAANANRRGLEIQNVGANNVGINEFGGTAVIGSAGTYTLIPGASMRVRTSGAITAIAATASTDVTATEW